MSKLLLTLLSGFLLSAPAIAGDVPAVVQKAFEQKFPNAKSVKWETENVPVYLANFKLEKVKYSASFNDSGEWLETVTMLAFAELPLPIKKSYNRTYSVGTAETISKIETSNGSIKFRMKFKTGLYGFVKVQVFYLPDGTEIE